MLIKIVLLVFVVIELMNVITLYFKPDSKMGNGLGVFKAFSNLKCDDKTKALIMYLVNWVAGVKLIFISLIIVIVITGSETTQIWALIVMILSIASFFWRLYPSMKVMDSKGWLEPSGYSKSLFWMIAGMIIMFGVALIIILI